MPEDFDSAVERWKAIYERASDRVELLTDEQRSRLLFRLCDRCPDLVNTAIDDFERTAWRWGE